MSNIIRDSYHVLRKSEYTGENRCVPCTLVNLVIAIVIAAVASTVSIPVALTILGLSLLLIYTRGYLIPGTPTLTKRYLPERVLRWFDKYPDATVPADEEIDVEAVLKAANAVTDCEHTDDLCLTDDFQNAWRNRITTLRENDTTRDDLATILDVNRDRLSFTDHGTAFVATADDRRIGQWESHAAFIADVAAALELRDRYPPWQHIDIAHRSRILNGLRIFLDHCPECDGPITLAQDVVESCCRSIDVVASTCDDCGTRLFETETPS